MGFHSGDALPRGYILDTSDNLVGKKRKLITGCGSLHCVAFFDPITGELMETYLSKGSQGGCNSFMVGLSRMISLSARAGVDINAIIDQLHSATACPSYSARHASKRDTSKGNCCPSAIAYALKDMWEEMQSEIAFDDNDESYEPAKEQLIVSGNTNDMALEQQSAHNDNVCPECGAPIIHIGGCVQCSQCSWSRCG